MQIFTDQLKALIKPTVESMGYEFWGMTYQGQGGRSLLSVFIEAPEGVTIDDCEKVSRQLASLLDAEDVIRSAYRLEVSSPGIDRQLFEVDHYERNLGKTIKVKLLEPVGQQKNFVGVVNSVDADGAIQLMVEGKILAIPYKKIQTAHVQPNFSKPPKGATKK